MTKLSYHLRHNSRYYTWDCLRHFRCGNYTYVKPGLGKRPPADTSVRSTDMIIRFNYHNRASPPPPSLFLPSPHSLMLPPNLTVQFPAPFYPVMWMCLGLLRPDPFVRGTDPQVRIRIRIQIHKMSRIVNTAVFYHFYPSFPIPLHSQNPYLSPSKCLYSRRDCTFFPYSLFPFSSPGQFLLSSPWFCGLSLFHKCPPHP
jgi:hypothetical protein